MPFERGESNDNTYRKIFSIKYEMAMHQIKQNKTKFFSHY